MPSQTTVHASIGTQKDFPVLKDIPNWDASLPQHILVLSPDDLNSETAEKLKDTNTNLYKGKITNSQYLNQVTFEDYQSVRDDLEAYVSEKHPQIHDIIVRRDESYNAQITKEASGADVEYTDSYYDLAESLMHGSAKSTAYDLDSRNLENELQIITTDYNAITVAEIAAPVAGLKPENLGFIPGSANDWCSMTIAHEVGHANHYIYGYDLRQEIDADQKMEGYLTKSFKSAAAPPMHIVSAFQGMRAIASWTLNTDDMHMTNAAVQEPFEKHVPVGAPEDFIQQLHTCRDLVSYEVGAQKYSFGKYTDCLQNIISGEEVLPGYGVVEVTLQDESVLKNMIAYPEYIYDGSDKNPAVNLNVPKDGFINYVSEDLRNTIDSAISEIDIQTGRSLLSYNSSLLYETTHQLYIDGQFDEYPLGKEYAFEFLKAGSKYAPEHFGTSKEEFKLCEPVVETSVLDVFNSIPKPEALPENKQPSLTPSPLGQ